MKSRCLQVAIALLLASACALSQSTIDLAGSWRFKADPGDIGIKEQWFLKQLPEKITLPGSMAQNGKGNDISVDTKWTGGIVDKSWFTEERYEKYRQPGNVKVPFWLNPVKSYVGAACTRSRLMFQRIGEGSTSSCFWSDVIGRPSFGLTVRRSGLRTALPLRTDMISLGC